MAGRGDMVPRSPVMGGTSWDQRVFLDVENFCVSVSLFMDVLIDLYIYICNYLSIHIYIYTYIDTHPSTCLSISEYEV